MVAIPTPETTTPGRPFRWRSKRSPTDLRHFFPTGKPIDAESTGSKSTPGARRDAEMDILPKREGSPKRRDEIRACEVMVRLLVASARNSGGKNFWFSFLCAGVIARRGSC